MAVDLHYYAFAPRENVAWMEPETPPQRLSFVLTDEEIISITGIPELNGKKQYAKWERALRAMGLTEVWRGPAQKPRVVLPRAHYDAFIERQNAPPAPTPVPHDPDRYVKANPFTYEGSGLERYHRRLREESFQREADHKANSIAIAKHLKDTEKERAAEANLERAALVRYHASKRRVTKLQRTPAWADQESIRAIYDEAARRTAETGVPHHVDHTIPLQGKLVSGLHVHNNLQVLTGAENSRKKNRFEVE